MSQSANGSNAVRVLVAGSGPGNADMPEYSEGRGLRVVGVCPTAREALRHVKKLKPDVLLASWDLPDMDGLSLLRQLRKRNDVHTILLGRDVPARELTEAVALGAAAALDSRVEEEILLKCIHSVVRGEYWFRRDLTRSLLESLPEARQSSRRATREGAMSRLTPRETDVMQAVARGKTNREIALELKLSEHTVKQHLKQVFGKLRVSSRVELVLHLAKASHRQSPLGTEPSARD